MMKKYIFIAIIYIACALPFRVFAVDGACELNVEFGDDDDPCIVVNNVISNSAQIPLNSTYYDECSLERIIDTVQNNYNGDHYCKFDDSSDYNKNARVIGFQPKGMPSNNSEIPNSSTLTEIDGNKNQQIQIDVKPGETWLFTGTIFMWNNDLDFDVCLGDPNDNGECDVNSNRDYADSGESYSIRVQDTDKTNDFTWEDEIVQGSITGLIANKNHWPHREFCKWGDSNKDWCNKDDLSFFSYDVTVLDPYLNKWGSFTPPNWLGVYLDSFYNEIDNRIPVQYRANILTNYQSEPAIVLKGSGIVIFRDINFIAKKQIMEIDGPTVYFERVTIENMADVELKHLIHVKSGALIFGNGFPDMAENFKDPNLAVYVPCEQFGKDGKCSKIATPVPPKAYISFAKPYLVPLDITKQKFEYNEKTAPWVVDKTSEIPCIKINDKQCEIESLEYDTTDTGTCNSYPCFAEHSRTYKAAKNNHGPAKLKKLKTKTVSIDTVLYTKCATIDYPDGACDSANGPYIGHKLKLIDEVKPDITCGVDDGNTFPDQIKLKSADDSVNIKCKITLGNGWAFGAGNKAWIRLGVLPSYLGGLVAEYYFDEEFDIKENAKDAEFSVKIPKDKIKNFGIPVLVESMQKIKVKGFDFETVEKYVSFQKMVIFIEEGKLICSDGSYYVSCKCGEGQKWDSASASCIKDCGADADVVNGKCECKDTSKKHNSVLNKCYDPSAGGTDGKKEYEPDTDTWVCKEKIEGADSVTCSCPAGTKQVTDINDDFKQKCEADGGGGGGGIGGDACSDDSDCGNGEVCNAGKCEASDDPPEDLCAKDKGLEWDSGLKKCVCQNEWHIDEMDGETILSCAKYIEYCTTDGGSDGCIPPPEPSCNVGEKAVNGACVCDSGNGWTLNPLTGECQGGGGTSAAKSGCGCRLNTDGTDQNIATILPYLILLAGLKAGKLKMRKKH